MRCSMSFTSAFAVLYRKRIQFRLPRAYLRSHGIEDLSGVGVNVTAPPCLAVCDRMPFKVSGIRVSQFQVDEDANRRRKYFNLKAGVSAVADKIKQELSPFRSAAAKRSMQFMLLVQMWLCT